MTLQISIDCMAQKVSQGICCQLGERMSSLAGVHDCRLVPENKRNRGIANDENMLDIMVVNEPWDDRRGRITSRERLLAMRICLKLRERKKKKGRKGPPVDGSSRYCS